MNKKRSLTLIELFSLVCVIFVFLGVFAIYIRATLIIAKETALRGELNNIRMSVRHFQAVKGELPKDLAQLLNKHFTFKGPDDKIRTRTFLKSFRINEQGELLDPFLNRYFYDNNGVVRSRTEGYEAW